MCWKPGLPPPQPRSEIAALANKMGILKKQRDTMAKALLADKVTPSDYARVVEANFLEVRMVARNYLRYKNKTTGLRK